MIPENIEISTNQGKLRGSLKHSAGVSSKTYYSFQGIPYGKPPVGKLRFQASEPFGNWEGVWNALKEGNDTIQYHMLFVYPTGDEDCLYLNVYTPQLPGEEGARKAVMVWIHGGGFACGSGSSELYGPDFFVEEGVVLVTINYRCGALGFLSLENDKLPGNLGLKDQVLALQWVQENISCFDGDPNNVTIFGESAGGASVQYHLLSPLSRGLFHRAILQCGSSLCQWAFQDRPRDKALLLARELGCDSQDPDIILDFLMTIPAADIVKVQNDDTLRTNKERVQRISFIFSPCVEVAGDVPFLTDYPRKLMQKGDFAKVPIIMGVNEKEGLLALAVKGINIEQMNSDLSALVPCDLAITPGSEEEPRLGKEILQFYTNTDTLSWDVVPQFVDLVSDIQFAIALKDSRQYFLKHQTSPVYSYEFSYISPRALSAATIPLAYPDKAAQFVGYGASHGDELIHQFKTNMYQIPFTPPTNDDKAFMKKFLKAWTTFAITGNPNCEDLGVTWKSDNEETPSFLEVGKVWKTVSGIPFPERMEFWRNIYEKYC